MIEAAVKVYGRQTLLEAANRAYALLQTDNEAWHLWNEELRDWDEALADGLEP